SAHWYAERISSSTPTNCGMCGAICVQDSSCTPRKTCAPPLRNSPRSPALTGGSDPCEDASRLRTNEFRLTHAFACAAASIQITSRHNATTEALQQGVRARYDCQAA